jgi:uncharacterized lipoprotein YddW (UPF0748 family)
MKRYILFIFLIVTFLLAIPSSGRGQDTLRRGMFVSMIQDRPVLASREEISKLIRFAKQAGIEVLFVQIYRSNVAWFSYRVADSSPYEKTLKDLGEDPFALLIREAHAAGIQVHAWLNMLSLGANENAKLLQRYGPSILTQNLKPKKVLSDYKIDDQYFLEPGDLRVRRELSGMVEEIVRQYPDLDGIQFDYIRYPDKEPAYGYAPANMDRFKQATGLAAIEEGDPAWNDWKRTQVTEFLEELTTRARKIRPDIQISTTGCAPYIRAYAEAFQDWPSWLNRGLVDFVTVMTYPPVLSDFERYITVAKTKTDDFKKVYIGVGAYKLIHSPEVFEQEFDYCERSGGGACVVFHYGSLLENSALSNFLAAD